MERRVWKGFESQVNVREPKKFIGKGRDVKSGTTNLRHLTKFGYSVAVCSMLTKYA